MGQCFCYRCFVPYSIAKFTQFRMNIALSPAVVGLGAFIYSILSLVVYLSLMFAGFEFVWIVSEFS